jgi:2,4-dienoyl-CoA reductase-like NADH-dependent reductase (Old Yellow Enzyme family)
LNDQNDIDPLKLYTYLITELEKRKIAFIELKDDNDVDNQFDFGYPGSKKLIPDLFDAFRPLYSGVLLANNQYTPQSAIEGIQKGKFDAVTFGRLFISNPDLVDRIRNGVELNTNWDVNTFFTKGTKGYLDYPLYNE